MVVALGVLLGAPAAGAHAPGLFGSAELVAGAPSLVPKWRDLMRRMAAERGRSGPAVVAGRPGCHLAPLWPWREALCALTQAPPRLQLAAVNRLINGWRYESDQAAYGVVDYWATPAEFKAAGGDCEDFAIAKYFMLAELGFPTETLRLVVLRDLVRGEDHAVLAAGLAGTTYILDIRSDELTDQAQLVGYVPYYAVNLTTTWRYVSPPEPVPAPADPAWRAETLATPPPAGG